MRPRPPRPVVRSFQCPACGHTLTVRAPGQSLTIACEACGAVLDPTDPGGRLVASYEERLARPRIPLGRRGRLEGVELECIGYLVRQVVVDGVPYPWREYLLWSPYHGYRWLVESDGHWTLLEPCLGMPVEKGKVARWEGREYRRFQTGRAEVTYVLGEFPWRVRRGDLADTADFVAPPYQLSKEIAGGEINWSHGVYLPGTVVWEAFGLEGAPPVPVGIAPAQPNPYDATAPTMGRLLRGFLTLAVLVQLAALVLSSNALVYEGRFQAVAGEPERSRVTDVFELAGRPDNLLIETVTNVDNTWAYFHYALINDETGEALNLGREVSYYHGVDGGESWSEGRPSDRVVLGSVPAGRWYLLVEPETPAARLDYRVRVRRGVPRWAPFFVALGLIVAPYAWFWLRRRSFEVQRWMNSDE